MTQLTLGLKLGPDSIGWAIVRDNPDQSAGSNLIDLGVRVFREGLDNFDSSQERSRNEDRRIARSRRRQTRRRSQRRQMVKEALIAAGLFPSNRFEQEELFRLNPYRLRAGALSKRLELFEFGRILLHINQRRGFLSNRKADRRDEDVKGMLAEIRENDELRKEGGFATVGAWLAAKLSTKNGQDYIATDHIRKRRFARQQLEDEFEAIWASQSKHHPALTEELKYGKLGKRKYPSKPIPRHVRRNGMSPLEAFGLYGLMFFQRSLIWPKSAVGRCEYEPNEKGCPRSDRHAQRFLLLQTVNSLRYTDPDEGDEFALSADQRDTVLDFLATRDKATYTQIKKVLGLRRSVEFNLERGQRPIINGMVVDYLMASAVNPSWHERPENQKDEIVRMLIDNARDDDVLSSRFVSEYGFTSAEAEAALSIDFPPGYLHVSITAVDKLLPYLQRGLLLKCATNPENSALQAAGYLSRSELQQRSFDRLPDPNRMRIGATRLGDLANPIVKRTMVELRKVINTIIRCYGKPARIHVALSSGLRLRKAERHAVNLHLRERAFRRETAAEAMRKIKVNVTLDTTHRYLIWQEQAQECAYCGMTIELPQLFTTNVELEHILPYARCLDDSPVNKVVCHAKCNAGKGNQTPYEWLAAAKPDVYRQVCAQARSLLKRGRMPYKKYRRFLQKELQLETCINRQFTDTNYVARAIGDYLNCLFDKEKAVLGLKGQLTSTLRRQWELDTLLREVPDSPAWHESETSPHAENNRADYRHHAIDAVVIALTDHQRLKQLSSELGRPSGKKLGEHVQAPWRMFREDVLQAIKRVNVSHRVERKVAGKLHEDTFYGPTTSPEMWVVRKPVVNLSANEIMQVRDTTIREIIIAKLNEQGIPIGRGKKTAAKVIAKALSDLALPSGVPIKKVRLLKPNRTIQPIRAGQTNQAFVKPGSMHHLCIFEWQEKGRRKREAIFVTVLEASARLKNGTSIVQRTHPTRPDAKFVMSLSSREMVLAHHKERPRLITFKTAASTQGRLHFAEHTDARRGYQQAQIIMTVNSLDARKVTVDPLGRIRWAND